MAEALMSLPSEPYLFVLVPPPLYTKSVHRQQVVNQTLPVLIPQMASEMGLAPERVVSLFDATGGDELSKPELFSDGLHPNSEGYAIIAECVYHAIQPCL